MVSLLNRITDPIPFGLSVLNFIVQRIFRINNKIKWPVHYTSKVTGKVKIGKDVWISFACNGNCYIQGANGVIIGDGTIFAAGVKMISANHEFSNYKEFIEAAPITIGNNCWIGANSVILPGVTLGDNVIVGAGSIVTKSFHSNLVIAGNPARIIRDNANR